MLVGGNRRSEDKRSSHDSPLRGAEFRAILIAEGQSIAGDQLARVALSVLVYHATSSAALTAVTYALTFLPDAVAGPLLAWLADRYPRRTVMISSALVQAVLVAVMAIPGVPLWLLFTCVAGEAFALAPFMAARNASLPTILAGPSELNAGQARLTTVREAGQMLGLAGAGAAVAFLGTTAALALDALSYLLTAALLAWRVRRRAAPVVERDEYGRITIEPDPRRPVLVTFSLLAALTVLPHALIVPLVAEIGAPTWSIGLLLAADSAGLVLAAQVFCRPGVPVERYHRQLAPLAVICLGAMIPFAVTANVYVVALLLAVSGAGAAYQIMAKSAYLMLLPDGVRGRKTGQVRSGLRALQGIGVLLGGVVAEWTGSTTTAIAAAGALGVVISLGAALAWQRTQPAAEAAPT